MTDREDFDTNKAVTQNDSAQQRSNVNRSDFQQNQDGRAPSSTSAPASRNKSQIIARIPNTS